MSAPRTFRGFGASLLLYPGDDDAAAITVECGIEGRMRTRIQLGALRICGDDQLSTTLRRLADRVDNALGRASDEASVRARVDEALASYSTCGNVGARLALADARDLLASSAIPPLIAGQMADALDRAACAVSDACSHVGHGDERGRPS
jgi:hypothetical protein